MRAVPVACTSCHWHCALRPSKDERDWHPDSALWIPNCLTNEIQYVWHLGTCDGGAAHKSSPDSRLQTPPVSTQHREREKYRVLYCIERPVYLRGTGRILLDTPRYTPRVVTLSRTKAPSCALLNVCQPLAQLSLLPSLGRLLLRLLFRARPLQRLLQPAPWFV